MMDKETYKREIVRMWDSLRFDEHKGEETCCGVDCRECALYYSSCEGSNSFNAYEIIEYAHKMIEFVEKWSKEHPQKKYRVSKLEYDILKYLSDNTTCVYITRDKNGDISLSAAKPQKRSKWWGGYNGCGIAMFNKLFQFVQWEDKEPTKIEYILENCEVTDNDE